MKNLIMILLAAALLSAAPAADTVLYYAPDGGEYYHLDPNCPRVNRKDLPLEGMFLSSELNSEPWLDLKPCEVCSAPGRK